MRASLLKALPLAALALAIGTGGAFALRALRPADDPDRGEEVVASAVKVLRQGPDVVVKVSPAALRAAGISVGTLAPAAANSEREGLATVLSLQPLLEQRKALLSAQADLRRADLAATAAEAEASRVAALHADDRIASDKALEAARVAAESERAGRATARSQLDLLTVEARRQWGPVVGGWLVRGAPRLDQLIAGRTVLLQVSGADLLSTPPTGLRLLLTDDGAVTPEILGPAAQADPKFQSPGYLALAPARPGLAPGVTVPARLSTGVAARGLLVPDSAVVRWQGHAYVYVERQPGLFARAEMATDLPASGGWLVRSGLPGDGRVVLNGAQLLLSQEQTAAGDTQ